MPGYLELDNLVAELLSNFYSQSDKNTICEANTEAVDGGASFPVVGLS